jgi:hypothetical protein
MESLSMPSLPLVIVSHPIGGLKPEEVTEKADGVVEDIIAHLVGTQQDREAS